MSAFVADTSALRAAAAVPHQTVHLAPGRYALETPLMLASGVSLLGLPCANGVSATISGGKQVGPWERMDTELWRAPLPRGGSPRQLWCDGRRANPARHPNLGYLRWQSALPAPFAQWGLVYEPFQGLEAFGERLAGADLVLFWSWTASRHRVVSHHASSRTILFDRPSREALGAHSGQSGRRFLIEGHADALDAPGEWAVVQGEDASTGTSLLYRPSTTDPSPNEMTCFVATDGLTRLMVAEGTEAATLAGLLVENVTVEFADWQLPSAPEMVDWQAAAHLRDAAIMFSHVWGARLRGLTLRHVGGYGVWLGVGARRCSIEGSYLHDLGAGGVRIGAMQRVSSPAATNAVLSSRIVDGGHVWREGVGVLVHRSAGNTIADSEIAHLGYTGISLGWEWGYGADAGAGGNTVARNFIHHIGRWELCDMGGIYVLGRSEGTVIESNVIAWVASWHMCD